MPEKACNRSGGLAQQRRSADVDALASTALSLMAARRSGAQSTNRAAHLRDLFDASIMSGGEHLRALVQEILRLGVAPETVSDIYVPEVARRLGAAWMADRLSFVEVSVGTAQLQAVARDLAGAPESARGGLRVAVVVPAREDHTLGAVVLTGQLRRMGISVTLHLGETPDRVAASLRNDQPDAVLISASHAESVMPVADLVAVSRQSLQRQGTVTVGGPILDLESVDVLDETGADHASSDPAEVLGRCRLDAPEAPALRRERTG